MSSSKSRFKISSSKKSGKWAMVDPTPNDLALRMSSQESMTSQLSCPSTPHEESVLELYFQFLSQANCDRAKDVVDSEKDGHKFSSSPAWGETLQCLSQLATAEKGYAGLVFLGQKRLTQIMRTKDSCKSIYTLLLQEFQRMENRLAPSLGEAGKEDIDQLLAHISGQLFYFIRARVKMIEFYEQLASLGSMRQWMNFDDLVMMCEEILKDHMKGFYHPLLSPIKTVFSLESESLCHLLHAQNLMSTWSYLPCVLQLHHAHSKLNTWSTLIPAKEVKSTFGRSATKSSPMPSLYHWLLKLKGILLSKFALYFYNTLSKQTVPAEMKANLAKTPEDFVGRIQVFQKKTDATNVFLVLDSHGLGDRGKCGGYIHPDKYVEPLQGMETYPAIFSYPYDRAINPTHWPHILMLINSNDDCWDRVKFVYDKATEKRPHSSYFISRVDTRVSLVVIFECKKNEKDSSINSFMNELAAQLRCQYVMAAIKTFARS